MKRRDIVLAVLAAVAISSAAQGEDPPFERTETRERCDHYTATRQPFFGELHLHTQHSLDAAAFDTRTTPEDAYRFARGERIGQPPYVDTRQIAAPDTEPPIGGVSSHPTCLPPDRCEYTATRTIQLPEGRALDFAAVTDHSEFLGETNICFFEGLPCDSDDDCREDGLGCHARVCVPVGYDSPTCILLRQDTSRVRTGGIAATLVGATLATQRPTRLPFCRQEGSDGEPTCESQARNVWQQIVAAAEGAYDRSSACSFTSFIGYEFTAQPLMKQCIASSRPCFADEDCGKSDGPCATRGQCAGPEEGKLCFVLDQGGTVGCRNCIADSGGQNNLHRNVIFRNANVPDAPISDFDAPTGCGAGEVCRQYEGPGRDLPRGTFSSLGNREQGRPPIALGSPMVLLETLRQQCNRNDPTGTRPCEFLSIPHNSNLSGGAMFLLPESPEEARVRGEHERLVELIQIKGGSECRYAASTPGWQPGAFQADELCDFENMSFAKLAGAYLVEPDDRAIPASSYVRNVLKDGLRYQQEVSRDGVNPFQLGFVGGLDNHNGTPGASDEVQYAKTGAHGDYSFAISGQILNETYFPGLQSNGGSLTVAWAEENSRDSIFAAMKRRETYATSGTRPLVRVFGGFDLGADMCDRGGDFAARGYAHGVPMGGTLRQDGGERAPRFAIQALMDPGWPGHPGTTLQRAQVVKGWVDADGEVHERVYDVAGGVGHTVPVDLSTCKPGGSGERGLTQLCTVWTDPHFDPGQHAFYYARILENPSCRFNQYYCLDRGVDCTRPPAQGRDVVGYSAYEYQQCCSDKVPKAVQQRAWTSPIWYRP